MCSKYILCSIVALTLLGACFAEQSMSSEEPMVENSTESPIADMALIDAEMKTSTEKPPTVKIELDDDNKNNEPKSDTQRHTVADFIIHPLIAFKARNPEEEIDDAGKQASSSTSTTTPSPWQLFGFNPGQGLGSLAGSVTGWLNDRIQLPGLVETPVRESTTTSSSTTTTTTPRPDVVVRVQHKPSTRRPLIAINNRNRPPKFENNNLNFDSEEEDDDYDDDDIGFQNHNNNPINNNNNRRRRKNQNNQIFNNNNNNYNNFDDYGDDYDEDDYEEDHPLDGGDDDDAPIRRKKGSKKKGNKKKHEEDEEEEPDEEDYSGEGEDAEEGEYDEEDKRKGHSEEDNSAEDNAEDDEEEDDDEEDEPAHKPSRRRPGRNGGRGHEKNYGNRVRVSTAQNSQLVADVDSVEDNEQFFYGSRPATKRSQSQANFIQRGQQSLINQIRQLTRVQSPAQVGTIMRQSQPGGQKRRQATLFINRNGQTVYMAPELLGATTPVAAPQYQYYPQVVVPKRTKTSQFPQPPLTKPLKRTGRPTQYITIPWSRLGISPPDQIVSIADGLQAEPQILNIPQDAINAMSNPTQKRKRPIITSDAVPLLAEASLMDIFQPPQIPPSRTSTSTISTTVVKPAMAAGSQLLVATKVKPSTGSTSTSVGSITSGNSAALLPHRIRGGTIVERAPAMDSKDKIEVSNEDSEQEAQHQTQGGGEMRNGDKEYILVGEDEEPGYARQVQPVNGDARYVSGKTPYLEVLHRGRFALRKGGRSLVDHENVGAVDTTKSTDATIPVQVINEGIETSMAPESQLMIDHLQPQEGTPHVEKPSAESAAPAAMPTESST